ncbi:MAG TPA: transcription antitermination factor NusB [Streptosporangiaceae bacterium]
MAGSAKAPGPASAPGRGTGRKQAAGGSPRPGRRPGPAPAGGPRSQRPRQGRADPVRRAACDVLCAVAERDAYANLLLPAVLAQRGLGGRDAALATELTYGTLRGQGTYDAVLAICSDRDLGTLDLAVREILRLGTHQLLATRVAPHAAVATSVDLVRDIVGQRAAGFVNAILRRVSTRDLDAWLEIAAPSRADDIIGHLAVRYSHPRWIVTALSDALGETPPGSAGQTGLAESGLAESGLAESGLAASELSESGLAESALAETEAVLAADNERPRVTLCAVPGLAEQAELAEWGASPARWSEFGAYLRDGDPARIPAVAQARAGAQDEASQLAAIALTRVPVAGSDSRWLDLCAGPGGKARLLAGLAVRSGARLLAAELREHRARLVRSAVSAWPSADQVQAGRAQAGQGGPPAGVVVADGRRPAWAAGTFDRVIADVPCSGLGALRRRPEARWRRSPETVSGLHGLQRRLLRTALDSVRPGGVVAFVTCTPHLAETRGVLADVLPARRDVEVLDAPAILAEVPGLACSGPDSRYAQFWPHRHGTDGIFIALLRRLPAA